MEKSDFKLEVIGLQSILDNPNIDSTYDYDRSWVEELMSEDGYTIAITAWENDSGFMIDLHVTELFPELIRLGVEELQEGDMYYSGGLDVNGLIARLINMGYRVATSTSNVIGTLREVMQPSVDELRDQMNLAADNEDYEEAAKLRDMIKVSLIESFRQ
jgi:hypothetical protein